MNKGIENRDLIKKIILHNDSQAFNVFYNTYYNPLVRFAFSITRQLQASEDIVSDIFFRLLKNKESSLNILNLESYLFQSVKYEAVKYLKRNRIQLHQEFETDLKDGDNPLQQLIFYELDTLLDKIVEQMPERRKQIFKMVKNEGLKYRQVAEQLDISVKTVENQMSQAFATLRKAIAARYNPSNTNAELSNFDFSFLLLMISSYHVL